VIAMSAASGAILSLTSVNKRFGDRNVLENINLEIPKGAFISLLGPSGCGKSTLLELIAGLQTASSGNIRLHDKPLSGANSAAGMVFQKDLLLEWLTVMENILMQFRMRGLRSRQHRDRAHHLLTLVGLRGFADAYPRELSGGMRQRVALCRALVHDPELLLMDEPFGALDAITREKVAIDLARVTAEENKSVVFVTHSLEEAVFLGDTVYVLSARPGRISERIDVDIQRPRRSWPRGNSEFTPFIDRAFAALRNAGAYDGVDA
jgi:NitT/TauT family transport system ATP-binding protein